MAIQISPALRDYLLTSGSLYAAVNGYVIKIYKGTVPSLATAEAPSADLLCTVSTNSTGTGLAFESSPSNGMLSKQAAAVWSGAVTASGTNTATYYRLCATGDTNAVDGSNSYRRVQGTVGLAGADLNVTSDAFTLGQTKRIDYYVIGMLLGS